MKYFAIKWLAHLLTEAEVKVQPTTVAAIFILTSTTLSLPNLKNAAKKGTGHPTLFCYGLEYAKANTSHQNDNIF